jgi:two-component system heavy metal sensor histidine kinase CusS
MQVLTGKLELARKFLAEVHSSLDFDDIPKQLDTTLVGHKGLALVVVAPGGRILFATSGADFPKALLDKPMQYGTGQPTAWKTREGQPLRGISWLVETGIQGEPPVTFAIAIDISHHEHFMHSFRITLWSFVILAALMTGFLGWIAARRGLAPLQSINKEAAGVTANSLHTRLSVDTIPVELAEVANTLNAMLARLEESFQRLSDFSSDLAHELRTPVSNLLTQTQVTLSQTRTPDDYRDILVSNTEELERMARMIADMLFLAKADNGLMVPVQEEINLAAETRELFDFYGALAEEKNISLALEGEGAVNGDRLMLRRAISNLLSNAIRHSPPRGWIEVRIEQDGKETRLTVSNCGTPIPTEHLPRLFDRFYRVDASRHRSSEGAGLGLAITKSILAAHGGEIVARTGEDENIFEIRFHRT